MSDVGLGVLRRREKERERERDRDREKEGEKERFSRVEGCRARTFRVRSFGL